MNSFSPQVRYNLFLLIALAVVGACCGQVLAASEDAPPYRRFIEAEWMDVNGPGYEPVTNGYCRFGRAVAFARPDASAPQTGSLHQKLERTLAAGRYLVWILLYIDDAASRQGDPIRITAKLGNSSGSGEVARDGSAALNLHMVVDAKTPFDTLSIAVQTPVKRLLIDTVYLSAEPSDFDIATAQRNHLLIGIEKIRRSLQAGHEDTSQTPPNANLLRNGSFELGLPTFDWSTPYQSSYTLAPSHWTGEDAAVGDHSLRVPLYRHLAKVQGDEPDQVTSLVLTHKPLPLKPNTTYTFRGMFRTDAGDPPVRLQLAVDPAFAGRDRLKVADGRHATEIGPSWQAVTFSFTTPDNDNGYLFKISAQASHPAALWMDGFTLSTSPVDHYIPAGPLELGVYWTAPGRVFHLDQPAEFEIRLHADPELTGHTAAQVRVRIVDYFNRTIDQQTVERDLADTSALVVDVNRGQTGAFRLVVDATASLATGPFQIPSQEYTFSIVPRPPDQMHHTLGAYITLAPQPIEIMSRAGVRSTTTLSCSNELLQNWRFMEPKPGEFVWVDQRVNDALDRDMQIIANIDLSNSYPTIPDWALNPEDESDRLYAGTTRGRQSFSRSAWSNFIETITRHYAGRIDDWLIVDEPYHNMTPEEYVQLLKATYAAAKRGNPDCRVIAHGGYYAEWLPEAEQLGGFDYFDGLSDYARNATQGARLRDFARRHDKFLLTVEYEWNASQYRRLDTVATLWDRTIPWYQQPTQMSIVRNLQGMAWAGAIGFNRYDARYPGGDVTQLDLYKSLFELDGSLKPAGTAYAIAAQLFDGFHGVDQVMLHPAIDSFLYQSETQYILMLSTSPQHIARIQTRWPEAVRILNMMGNEQTGDSVLLSRAAHYVIGPLDQLPAVKEAIAQCTPQQAMTIRSQMRLDDASGQYVLVLQFTNRLDEPITDAAVTLPHEWLRTFQTSRWVLPTLGPGEQTTLKVGLNLYEDDAVPDRDMRMEYYVNGSAANITTRLLEPEPTVIIGEIR